MPNRTVRMCNPTHRFDTPTESGPTTDPTIRWDYQFQHAVQEVAVWGDSVHIAVGDSIVAIGQDGTSQWRFQTDDPVDSSPAVVDGIIYVGSSDYQVYALDANTGTQQWAFQTDSWVYSSPAVVDGTVYVGSSNDHVYALDANTGTQQWAFQTDGAVYSSPAVVDDTVYIGSDDEYVYALDATIGTQQWAFQADGKVESSPTVANGTVYVGDFAGDVYALDGRETEVFGENPEQTRTNTRVYQTCSDCGADLAEHETLNFCPECGAEQ